jgi:hypothetical protein
MVNQELYETLDSDDTRYYGVFLSGHGDTKSLKIDPKRYQKTLGLTENMKAVMDQRKTGHYFKPAKKRYLDYNVNLVTSRFGEIRREWNCDTKPMINHVLTETKGKFFTPGDDDQLQCGIIDYTEAATIATIKSWESHNQAEIKRNKLYCSLYSQFFQQLTAQIEALTLLILTCNGYEGDSFSRNVLYAFKGNKPESIRKIEGFTEYDKMYAVWNFLKHNSLSTYQAIKDNFGDILIDGEYKQGELACYYVRLSDGLIDSILSGVECFLKEYCKLVLGEDENEAAWNYEDYFTLQVREAMQAEFNPLGISDWI